MGDRIEVTLDISGCRYLGELHQRIKDALDFPDYYGENWDAFWDLMRFDCPVEYIRIVGEQSVSPALKGHLDKLHELLEKCRHEQETLGFKLGFEVIS